MEEVLASLPTPLRKRQRKTSSEFKTASKRDKIQNVLTVHHYDQGCESLEVDLQSNSVTTKQCGESRRVHKTFLFDSVSSKDPRNDEVLVAAIRRVAEKEDSLILSVSRGLRKKSLESNRHLLGTLVHWLMEYLFVCSDGEECSYSVRLSALEVNEEKDIIRDLAPGGGGRQVTLDNQLCRRCTDSGTAVEIIKEFHANARPNADAKQQYLFTIHVYQHESHTSIASSVSSKCSRIFLLWMDLVKQDNNAHCLSPPGFAKLLTESLSRTNGRSNIQSNFQNLIFDIFKRCNLNFTMITQISVKEKHMSDTYQLLQLASRIQRLKVKSRKCWDSKDGIRPSRPTMGIRASLKGEKYSDTEATSTSEISCAETVIFLGEENRRNSDNESRRLRSIFMSSDSDSGCRDWKMCQSGGSRVPTPVNEEKKQIRPRTNALVWPKAALRMAKTAMMNGEELWVDGPNAFKKSEMDTTTQPSESTISTLETIENSASLCVQSSKPVMVSQETQCEDQSSVSGIKAVEEPRQLSDISELTEDNDSARNSKECQPIREDPYKNCPSLPQDNSDEYSRLEKNDVQNLSNWIHDVNELTTYQEFLTRSHHENLVNNLQFLPLANESINSHSYEYYDPGSQGEYCSFPRMFPQIQYTANSMLKPLSERRCNGTPESDKGLASSSACNKKTKQSIKKKDNANFNCMEKYSKSKAFCALGLLKKTLMRRKKSKEMPERLSDVQSCSSRCPEVTYLAPVQTSPDESSDSSSSDSECNEWFRKVKTFKSKVECSKNKSSVFRPPSAPLSLGSGTVLRSQYSYRQRSSSSGYGSVVTRDSEMSSHLDSTSDQSIHTSSKNQMKLSMSFTNPLQQHTAIDSFDSDLITRRCELLVKQEKAFLLVQQQEIMIQDFYASSRLLLTSDSSKYSLKVSEFDLSRVTMDNQYLEELQEDTNVIRDSIAFYKSLVQLESSFVTSPGAVRRNIH